MGRFTRPKATILPDESIVPEKNLVSPHPNKFTHELSRTEPYYYSESAQGKKADGKFSKGTKVVMLRHDGPTCRVVDRRGLYVEVAYDSLKPISSD
jgi:hypothetical protein